MLFGQCKVVKQRNAYRRAPVYYSYDYKTFARIKLHKLAKCTEPVVQVLRGL